MEWLNTSVTFLNSPEFRRSKIEQRGVWLTLIGYCVQQENGGRITGTQSWTEWDWQQVLGVSEKAVHEDCTLWNWEDEQVLVLHGYPLEKEEEIKAKRRAGRRGGIASGKTRAVDDASSTASRSASSSPSSSPSRTASTEGERNGNRRGIGKERKENRQGAGAPSGMPSLEEWTAEAQLQHPDWPEVEARAAWSHYEAAGWMLSRGKPVQSWQPCIETCFARWQGAGKKSASGGDAPGGFDSERPHAHTGGMEVFENAPAAGEAGS